MPVESKEPRVLVLGLRLQLRISQQLQLQRQWFYPQIVAALELSQFRQVAAMRNAKSEMNVKGISCVSSLNSRRP